ncbi:MAG TPA: WbqC family protein [Bdellovibrionota bacterium]|jgi:hypothetical protein
MRVVCQQPNYFPWLGYFEQIARADSFVFLDDVQWIKQGRQHRTRLPQFASSKTDNHWLTLPVKSQGHRGKPLHDIEVDSEQPWAKRHWQTILSLYGGAPYFKSQLEPLIRPFLEGAQKHKFLADICESSVALFWKPLDLKSVVWHSSHMPVKGKKSARLLELCQALDATEYYSALGASRYLEMPLFRDAGLRVRWQHFRQSAGPDPRRSCDYSILDWVALNSWQEVRAKLGTDRGSAFESALAERAVDAVMGAVDGTVH